VIDKRFLRKAVHGRMTGSLPGNRLFSVPRGSLPRVALADDEPAALECGWAMYPIDFYTRRHASSPSRSVRPPTRTRLSAGTF